MVAKTRNFVLRDAQGNENGVFTGKSPRQAALKAANRGYTDIRLRERGTSRSSDLAARQDLEAQGQKGGHRETYGDY